MQVGIGIGIDFSSKARKVVVRDDFNRADNSSTLGIAETGQTWSTAGSGWGVVGQTAYCLGTTGVTGFAFQNAGVSDCIVNARIQFSFNEGVALRYQDLTNQLAARLFSTGLALVKNVAGTNTSILTYAFTPVVGTWYNIRAICVGSSIRILLDGVERINTTETAFQTLKNFGLKASDSPAGRFDAFTITSL